MRIEHFSKHALCRAFQRHFDMDKLDFILRYGRKIHNGGALFVFLGKHDIPSEYLKSDRYSKLEGSTLIVSAEGDCLITTYKNKDAIRQIRKKGKRYVDRGQAA